LTPSAGARLDGVITTYDDHAGFGQVQAEPDDATYWFHCTRLLDGSRHAEPGQRVGFRVVPGHAGRWEAAEVG
jgi:cold shock CspA family protein